MQVTWAGGMTLFTQHHQLADWDMYSTDGVTSRFTQAHPNMREVLRLIRLTLLLRILVAAAGALVASTMLPGVVGLELAVALPSFLVLGFTFVASFKRWEGAPFVKGLLAAVILAQAVEAVVSRIGFQTVMASLGINLGQSFTRTVGGAPGGAIMRLPLSASLLFITIPALLGAWVSGRHGALRWAAFAVLMSMLSNVTITSPELAQLRLNAGLFGAQAMVVFITCYFVGILADQQRAEQAELEKANHQLAEQALVREQLAGSRERVRLARDLHDTLAHTLAGLVVQANVVNTLIDKDPMAARRELARIQAVAKEGLEEARAAISDLRANMVQDLGLSGALRRLAEMTRQRADLDVTFEQSGDDLQLDKDSAETLFRIVQEAVTNIERHARAKHVDLSITQTPPPERTIVIRVRDDGVGFNVTSLDDERFGLRGMRERAELIGAHLRLDSTLGVGTTVTVTLRLQANVPMLLSQAASDVPVK